MENTQDEKREKRETKAHTQGMKKNRMPKDGEASKTKTCAKVYKK